MSRPIEWMYQIPLNSRRTGFFVTMILGAWNWNGYSGHTDAHTHTQTHDISEFLFWSATVTGYIRIYWCFDARQHWSIMVQFRGCPVYVLAWCMCPLCAVAIPLVCFDFSLQLLLDAWCGLVRSLCWTAYVHYIHTHHTNSTRAYARCAIFERTCSLLLVPMGHCVTILFVVLVYIFCLWVCVCAFLHTLGIPLWIEWTFSNANAVYADGNRICWSFIEREILLLSYTSNLCWLYTYSYTYSNTERISNIALFRQNEKQSN